MGGGRCSSLPDAAACLTTGTGQRYDAETETLIPTGGCFDVAHTLRGEGFDASEDGTGRGTPLVPVLAGAICRDSFSGGAGGRPEGAAAGHYVAFSCKDHGADAGELAPTLRAMGSSDGRPNGGGQVAVAFAQNQRDEVRMMDVAGALAAKPGAKQQTYVQQAMAVRRLTPRECERLQGFPEVIDRVTLSVCFDHQTGSARVALKCHRWQTDAWPADADEWMPPADIAGSGSSTHQADPAPLVALHARLRFAAELLAFRSHERLLWCASAAGQSCKSRLPTVADGIAPVVVRLAHELALAIRAGKAASPVNIRLSSPVLNGGASAPSSGGATAESADAAASAPNLGTFTTSDLGRFIPTEGLTLGTLCCSALSAIAGFIPTETLPANFSVELTVGTPCTAIPLRNKAGKLTGKFTKDGPRYKALGNSWAVPVAAWVGRRIDAQLRGDHG